MKQLFALTALAILVGGALGWTANSFKMVQDNKEEQVEQTIENNQWVCPLCNRTIDHCQCQHKDYTHWINEHKGKVFCGVLFTVGNDGKNPEWIDPVAEESITAGDSSGWYKPTEQVKIRMVNYLKTCKMTGVKWWSVGLISYPDEGDNDLTEKFYKEVCKKVGISMDSL